ncbi:hypothetical protein WCQ02_33370 [Paraburkholderia tropica]|uniref:hypothetical protein n=1 Tax=Paraburkholderia tropica TaxID=92647 RepID=UPI003018B165
MTRDNVLLAVSIALDIPFIWASVDSWVLYDFNQTREITITESFVSGVIDSGDMNFEEFQEHLKTLPWTTVNGVQRMFVGLPI